MGGARLLTPFSEQLQTLDSTALNRKSTENIGQLNLATDDWLHFTNAVTCRLNVPTIREIVLTWINRNH